MQRKRNLKNLNYVNVSSLVMKESEDTVRSLEFTIAQGRRSEEGRWEKHDSVSTTPKGGIWFPWEKKKTNPQLWVR